MFVQLDRVDALWTTRYGLVLSKLALVAVLIGLAAANRFALVPRFAAAASAQPGVRLQPRSERSLRSPSWRWSRPGASRRRRALAASERVFLHLHGERGMAEIDIEPERGRGDVRQAARPGVAPACRERAHDRFANLAVEPMQRHGVSEEGFGASMTAFAAGRWKLQVEIRVSD
jgi:hypothetical protein